MKEYRILPLAAPLPALQGREFDPAQEPFCTLHACARIDSYVWEGQYTPEARAWMAWDESGLQVLLAARETEISAKARAFNDEVYRDSCLECFLKPFGEDSRYLNIEVNAAGTALIGLGSDRKDRSRLKQMPQGMHIRASEHRGSWWAVAYQIPFSLIRELFRKIPQPGEEMRGNFYKCDESLHPHFGSWNPIETPKPDFHRPECFGILRIEPSVKK